MAHLRHFGRSSMMIRLRGGPADGERYEGIPDYRAQFITIRRDTNGARWKAIYNRAAESDNGDALFDYAGCAPERRQPAVASL